MTLPLVSTPQPLFLFHARFFRICKLTLSLSSTAISVECRFLLPFLPKSPNQRPAESTQLLIPIEFRSEEMVHMMDSGNFSFDSQKPRQKDVRVKPELADLAGHGDSLDYNKEPHFGGFSISKRPKLDLSHQHYNPVGISKMDYNPLEEPSPLGLKLKKTPSFLDLIQMKLGQERSASLAKTLPRREKENQKGAAPIDKLKASNFPAALLKIGTWEYKSRHEGDLVAKCYFAKHKLVWEVLDGGLKNKIEVQWSDVMAIKASYSGDGPETLDVVLARQPLFFREINPQPRKHTLWQATSDFTGGQATIYRRHFLQCSQGLLGRHFEKLVQCDPRLNFLSQQPEIVLDNPYFEPKSSLFGGTDESGNSYDFKTDSRSLFDLHGKASTSAAYASHVGREDSVATPSELDSQGTPPPASDLCIVGGSTGNRMKETETMKILDQIKVPGIRPSMSMSDLVSHIGQCISEQMTTVNPGVSIDEEEKHNILEDIAQYLLTDSQVSPTLDEKKLMNRVNSLCCLLQKDPSSTNLQAKSDEALNLSGIRMDGPKFVSAPRGDSILKEIPESHCESNLRNDWKEPLAMSRKDSVGDLLMNLPRIASLPQFLFNLWEDHGAQS